MSIEKQLEELTQAISGLTAVMASCGTGLKENAPQVGTTEAPVKKAPAKKSPAKKPVAKAEEAATAETTEVVIDFDAVRNATRNLAQAKGRDAVVDLLTEFGATKAPEIKEADYKDYVTQAAELIAG